MGAIYRLFGSETSPYSLKVRSYLRYKKLPFDWVARGYDNDEEFNSLAKSQALPMLVSPKGGVAHDSSLIFSAIEAKVNKPFVTPMDNGCAVLAILLEEYADEWLNKVMTHYRWSAAKTAKAAAKRQAELIFDGYTVEGMADIEKSIAKTMTGNLKTIGVVKKNIPILEASFERFLKLLNAHLEHHLCIFGGNPSRADFALAGQLTQMMAEDIPGKLIRETAPFVAAWCEFMEEPRSDGPFKALDAVSETLLPLIRDEVAPTYIAWAVENALSISKKKKTVTVKIDDAEFKQNVQAQTSAAFADLLAAFAATPATEGLTALLSEAGLAETLPLGAAVEEKNPEPAAEETPAEETASEDTSEVVTVEADVVEEPAAETEAVTTEDESAPAEETTEETPAPETEEGEETTAEEAGIASKDA